LHHDSQLDNQSKNVFSDHEIPANLLQAQQMRTHLFPFEKWEEFQAVIT